MTARTQSARKQINLLLQRLNTSLNELCITVLELQSVLDVNQNEGAGDWDGSISEDGWNSTSATTAAYWKLVEKLTVAVDLNEVTEVTRGKRR